MKVRSITQVLAYLVVLSILIFGLNIWGFFRNLNTVNSDYSWGDVSYFHQAYYNLANNRPFQTSLYRTGAGVRENPNVYASTASIHVNFIPYLIAPLYRLWPSLPGLYFFVILLNYVSLIFFGWHMLRRLSPEGLLPKMMTILFALFASSFLFVFQYKLHFTLLATPLILASYDAIVWRRPAQFLLGVALLCMVSEDVAMFAATFCAYVYFFERPFKRLAVVGGIFSIAYILAVLFVIQPAARYGMTVDAQSHALNSLKHLELSKELLKTSAIVIAPTLFFLPAFALLRFLSAGVANPIGTKVVGLILVAPLSTWFIHLVQPMDQHTVPILICLFLAFVVALGDLKIKERYELSRSQIRMFAALVVFFIAANLFVLRGNLFGAPLDTEALSNQKVLGVIHGLPTDSSLVLWTNRSVEGFAANRSNLWRFPELFRLVDYFVIQKNAEHSWFEVTYRPGMNLDDELREGTKHSTAQRAVIAAAVVDQIKEELVGKAQTHQVAQEDQDVLVLQRINKHKFEMPPTTVGLGWVRNIPRLIK